MHLTYLKQPSNFDHDPLHGPEVEEHRDDEAEEVDHAEDFEHEDEVDGLALVDVRKELK